MKKAVKTYFLPVLFITLAGFLVLALGFVIYFFSSLAIEAIFYANNPQDTPTDSIRSIVVLIFGLVYLFIYFRKIPELVKAMAFTAVLAATLITLILRLYADVFLFLTMSLAITAIFIVTFSVFKKPWYYHYATMLGLLLAFLYAWPQ